MSLIVPALWMRPTKRLLTQQPPVCDQAKEETTCCQPRVLVHDTCGHLTGDKVLKEIARQLILFFRDSDTPGRIGGQEFAVILPESNIEEAVWRVSISERPLPIMPSSVNPVPLT